MILCQNWCNVGVQRHLCNVIRTHTVAQKTWPLVAISQKMWRI